MHPLLHLLATKPHLLGEHAQAYAELVTAEVTTASSAWKRKAALGAGALCCAGVAAVLAGVSVLLWAVVPAAQMHSPWALWVVPAVPVLLAGACVLAARGDPSISSFSALREQMKADMAMLREVTTQ